MDAQTVKAYDARAVDFAARHGAADASELQRILLKHLPAGGRVLEIGCGCGRDALFLAEHGFRVVATDASTGMLESFRKSAGDQVRIVDYAADRARTPATVSGSAQRKTVSTKSGDYEWRLSVRLTNLVCPKDTLSLILSLPLSRLRWYKHPHTP